METRIDDSACMRFWMRTLLKAFLRRYTSADKQQAAQKCLLVHMTPDQVESMFGFEDKCVIWNVFITLPELNDFTSICVNRMNDITINVVGSMIGECEFETRLASFIERKEKSIQQTGWDSLNHSWNKELGRNVKMHTVRKNSCPDGGGGIFKYHSGPYTRKVMPKVMPEEHTSLLMDAQKEIDRLKADLHKKSQGVTKILSAKEWLRKYMDSINWNAPTSDD